MTSKKKDQWLKSEGKLMVDVFETDSKIIVQAPIAGIKAKDLEITIEKDMIEIKGQRENPQKDREKEYLFKECWWGSFSRKIVLPCQVENTKSKAELKKGILNIEVPKIKTEKKTTVKIE